MPSKEVHCYIYTRVSTSIQVDGFSLDAQRDRLVRYAEYQNMQIVGEYSDAGKSGKNLSGRPDFMRMLSDIKTRKDSVDYVLVFKLSRFGRNAADVLNSLQQMQDYGVNLICVEDGIDSSKDSGKLMISVLSAVAEIERENILVQTMEGRRQKAREGRWNGGFAPYGYTLINGELQIVEDEAEIIRTIFDRYVNTSMGMNAIANWLNEHGYEKKMRQNGRLNHFSYAFVSGVLENPVYCGLIAYGRRKNEKISGTRNQFHVVSQKDGYIIVPGVHKPLISRDVWDAAQKKRQENGGAPIIKTHSLDHEHILSGILRCPICGAPMYGNVNRKKRPDGTHYKDLFYYQCKHRKQVEGVRCNYKKQRNQDTINAAVEEIVLRLVDNDEFFAALTNQLDAQTDTNILEKELFSLQTKLKRLISQKDQLNKRIYALDVAEKHYERKLSDMQVAVDNFYDQIDSTENLITEATERLANAQADGLNAENVRQYLANFSAIYVDATDLQKKQFMRSLISEIQIFPQIQPDGRILRSIKFQFPFTNNKINFGWDSSSHVETVVLLSQQRSKDYLPIEIDVTKMPITKAEIAPSYQDIKDYVMENYGFKVSSLNIAQVKRKHGLEIRENFNISKKGTKSSSVTPEREQAITNALKHFRMI